jgi:serine/threonine protein kinase
VHKDVTPRNILVSYDGAVKLIDFGVALARGRHTQSTVSAIQGKAGFVSPEVIRGDPTDRRSDIFSLGVVLYWLLTRTYPFVGKGQSDWTSRVLSGTFRRPRDIAPGIPPELEAVVLRAMANAPQDRYANAALMADDLDAFIGGRRYRDLGQKLSCIIREHFSQELYSHEEQLRAARGIPSIPAPPPKPKRKDKRQRTPLGIEVMDIGPDGRRRIRWTGLLGAFAGIAALVVLTVAILPLRSGPEAQGPLAAPELSNVEIRIKGVPDNALLFLDGQPVSPNRVLLPREGDHHELEIRIEERVIITKTIVAQPGLVVDFSSHFEK